MVVLRAGSSTAVTGAAPVPVELVRQMREDLGFELVVTAYGLTETHGVATANGGKDLLDKIGVEAQMLHCGAYKSALEPFSARTPLLPRFLYRPSPRMAMRCIRGLSSSLRTPSRGPRPIRLLK